MSLRDDIADTIRQSDWNFADDTATAILVLVREALLDPETAYDIASEMFLHGYDGDLRDIDTVPPIAIGAIIGSVFDECATCAEGEVRKRLQQAKPLDAVTGEQP